MTEAAGEPQRAPAWLFLVRLSPVVFLALAAVIYVFAVEGPDAYPWRNAAPMLFMVVLAVICLRRGRGHWTGAGWTWPLGLVGFAIPAVGLSLYLHYGYAHDLNGMYSDAVYPEELFRYLPAYTTVAGAIGFAIGWIAGRSASRRNL
jgi:hypothetical protein